MVINQYQIMIRYTALCFLLLYGTIIFAQVNPKTQSENFYIENKGQWDKKAGFLTRNKNIDSWILSNGNMLLDLYALEQSGKLDALLTA